MLVSHWTRSVRGLVLALAISLVAACGDLYSRTDFTTMIMNKSEQEVIKQIGKPSTVDDSNPDRVIWIYTNTTFDVDNQNKRDAKTTLTLERKGSGGKLMVTAVDFS